MDFVKLYKVVACGGALFKAPEPFGDSFSAEERTGTDEFDINSDLGYAVAGKREARRFFGVCGRAVCRNCTANGVPRMGN